MNTELLKKKILQLAMQGKLVKPDESDGTADKLIEKIIREKEQLMAEGKIKKEKLSRIYKNPTDNHYYEKFDDGKEKDITADIPYEIPSNWCWSRLGSIGFWKSGSTPLKSNSNYYINGTIPWIVTGDLNDNFIDKSSNYITKKALEECSLQLHDEGSVLIAMYGATIGKLGILNIKATTNQACCVYDKNKYINNKYLFYYLKFLKDYFKSIAVGGAQPNISREKIINTFIAIPPLSEQLKISNKIEELNNKITLLESSKNTINKLNNILKSKIIDMAIKGELTKQLDSGASASKLIENILEEKRKLIKEGKIKKENLSVIYKDSADNQFYEKFDDGKIVNITDEIPFDIPKEWVWSRLRNIGIYKKGPFGSSLTKSIFVPKGENTIKVYEQKNAINKDDKLGNYYISKEYFESNMAGFEVESGDIIVSCAGTIGETYILPDKIEKGIINQALMKMKIFYPINIEFFLIYFDQILKKEANKNGKGTAMKNIPPFVIFKEYLIPIPPLEEQNRIINKKYNIINHIETAY